MNPFHRQFRSRHSLRRNPPDRFRDDDVAINRAWTRLRQLTRNAFMQPEVWRDIVAIVETNYGTETVYAGAIETDKFTKETVAEYVEGTRIYDIHVVGRKWLARFTASGYLDSTPANAFNTELEAVNHLLEEAEKMAHDDSKSDDDDE
jgi:hypothetical protein